MPSLSSNGACYLGQHRNSIEKLSIIFPLLVSQSPFSWAWFDTRTTTIKFWKCWCAFEEREFCNNTLHRIAGNGKEGGILIQVTIHIECGEYTLGEKAFPIEHICQNVCMGGNGNDTHLWIWQKSKNDPVEKSQIDRLLFCENAIMWALPNCSSCGARQFQFCIVFRWSSFCFPLISADQSCQQVVITSLINVIVTFHSNQLVVFHEEKHQGFLLPNVLHICLKYIVIEYLQNKLKTLRSSILTEKGRLHPLLSTAEAFVAPVCLQ